MEISNAQRTIREVFLSHGTDLYICKDADTNMHWSWSSLTVRAATKLCTDAGLKVLESGHFVFYVQCLGKTVPVSCLPPEIELKLGTDFYTFEGDELNHVVGTRKR